ncbi:hypothetical protein Tco_0067606 [Tanacetum coccineum]
MNRCLPLLKLEEDEDANIAEWDNVQAMIDADYELAARLQAQEQEELNIEERSKMFKLFDKAMTRVNMFVDMDTELVKESSKKAEMAQESSFKRAGDELEQEKAKKQKIDDQEEAELRKLI